MSNQDESFINDLVLQLELHQAAIEKLLAEKEALENDIDFILSKGHSIVIKLGLDKIDMSSINMMKILSIAPKILSQIDNLDELKGDSRERLIQIAKKYLSKHKEI